MLLRRCFTESADRLKPQLDQFCAEHPWVSDYALFTAVKEHFSGAMFSSWPDPEIIHRTPEALRKYTDLLKGEIAFHVFCQFLFRRQWFALKKYCNERGILIFGDMPIYVAEDSADTWTHPEIFQLDRNRIPKRVAGVPPDYFSADGQLWGNPLYRWFRLRLHGYDWWVDRMKAMADMYDMIRIDHFVGFANYYSVAHVERAQRPLGHRTRKESVPRSQTKGPRNPDHRRRSWLCQQPCPQASDLVRLSWHEGPHLRF